MPFFKNKNFIKRNYETTDVIFCEAETAPNENWIECDASEVSDMKCQPLQSQAGVRYYGYL